MLKESKLNEYLFSLAPSEMRMVQKVNIDSAFFSLLSSIPFIKKLLGRILISRGLVFMRVNKVDPSMPDEYWVNGWKYRNKSERFDGEYYNTKGIVKLDPLD